MLNSLVALGAVLVLCLSGVAYVWISSPPARKKPTANGAPGSTGALGTTQASTRSTVVGYVSDRQ